MTQQVLTKERVGKMYKQKKFFSMVFNSILEKGGNFKEGHFVRIFQVAGEVKIVKFFNNIDDLVGYVSGNTYNIHTYFSIMSTDGMGGTAENIKTYNVIGIDFDRREGESLEKEDIMHRCNRIGLKYDAIVNSGNGFHIYMCIEPTEDMDKVSKVTKRWQELLDADPNATLTTQTLRVPYTWNIKDKEKKKLVPIIWQYPEDKIKRKNIEDLYKRYCTDASLEYSNGKNIEYTIKNTNIPKCIEEILENGSPEDSRYEDLKKIVVTLRKRNKSIPQIKAVCKEWSVKSGYKDSKITLDRVEKIYGSLNQVPLDCGNCNYKNECYGRIESDFNYDGSELGISETVLGKLKYSNRKNSSTLGGNEILIYTVLTNHRDGLFREELIKEITYKGKARFSDNTLTKTLKILEEQGLITVYGKPKFYKIVEQKTKIDLIVSMSYAAAYEAVKGTISTEELRLYYYMRYIHNEEQRENSKALKGNLFQISQSELASDLGVTQSRVSQMINNLLNEKLISIWHRQKSKNNGFDFYIYRLNY